MHATTDGRLLCRPISSIPAVRKLTADKIGLAQRSSPGSTRGKEGGKGNLWKQRLRERARQRGVIAVRLCARQPMRSMSAAFRMWLSHLDNGLTCGDSARASAQHGRRVQDVCIFCIWTSRWNACSESPSSRRRRRPPPRCSRSRKAWEASGEIHLSPSFWYTTAHGTFFLSFSVKCDIFWLFRAHGGNFLSFKQKRQKNATMGPARHTHA